MRRQRWRPWAASAALAALTLTGCGLAGAESSATTPTVRADGSLADQVASLPVKGRAPMTGYDRARFGQAWLDADRNGCDTRNDAMRDHLTQVTIAPGTNGCVVESGTLDDPYTGTSTDYVRGDGTLVDVDHVVALGNAWVTGAAAWDIRKRAAFANDPMNLLPVDASANRSKGDGDAATWLPPSKPFRCQYVARQVGVKAKYGLWLTPPELAAVERVLEACPDQAPVPDSGAPVVVDQDIVDPGPRADGSYENCDAARAAGATPVRRGDPGYGPHLDGDGDGVACE
jgi:hypothetical protein